MLEPAWKSLKFSKNNYLEFKLYVVVVVQIFLGDQKHNQEHSDTLLDRTT